MKRNLIGTLSLVVLSLLFSSTGYAQILAKADVPFAFTVAKKTLPPAATWLHPTAKASSPYRTKTPALRSSLWLGENCPRPRVPRWFSIMLATSTFCPRFGEPGGTD